jgi:hypothetical protein
MARFALAKTWVTGPVMRAVAREAGIARAGVGDQRLSSGPSGAAMSVSIRASITVCPPVRDVLLKVNGERTPMEYVLYHLVTLAVAAVIVVLLLGLWNLMRGSSPSLSQTLMRWRVGLQFVAIVIIVLYFAVHYR